MFMHIANGLATFAATDGKRLSRTLLPVAVDGNYTGSFVIPLKAIEEIQKNLFTEEGDIKIYLMTDKIAVETDNTVIISKLLVGEYPDISRVIPATSDYNVVLHREELMTLLRQVSLFAQENNHAARFTFTPGELHLDAASMKVGEGKVSMPVNYEGPPFEIAFNPSYFLDILRHSKMESVTLGISDPPYNPGIIVDQELPFVASEASPLFVLMPMRLNEE